MWLPQHRSRDRRRHGPHRSGRERGSNCRGDPGAEGLPMIGPSGAVRVMLATRPVDFRKGMDGLAALVLYVFRSKPADRVKLVDWGAHIPATSTARCGPAP